MGIGAHASLAFGREFGQFRFEAARLVEQFLRLVALQPVFQQLEVSGWSASTAIGTWCARNVPSICKPSTTFGPVQPLGDLSTIIGQRGRVASLLLRALLWICRMSRTPICAMAHRPNSQTVLLSHRGWQKRDSAQAHWSKGLTPYVSMVT